MRNLKKFLAVLVVVVMIATTIVPAFAADSYTYSDQAQKLYDLNLFQGLSDTTYDPGLGLTLDRQTGVVMLLRLIGKEAAATAMSDADATAALANFTDKGDVVDWAMKSMAYAVKNGLVQGMDSNVLGPKTNLTGKMYATMILRNLGYTVDNTAYLTAAATLAEKGGLTAIQAVALNDKAMIRDDLVGMSFGALQAKYSTGETVIDKLIADGVVTADKAVAAGVSYTITALANPADITVIAGGTITLPTTVSATLSNDSTKDVTVTWDKTVDANVVGTTTLTGTVAGTTLTAALKVIVNATAFTVKSVAQLNASSIKVTFTGNVDINSAQTKGNYKINGVAFGSTPAGTFGSDNGLNLCSIKASADSAILYSGAKLANDVSFTLEVNGVQSSSFTAAPVFRGVVTGNDTTAPSITKVTATAGSTGTTTSVTVEFSEGVNLGSVGTYKINGTVATVVTPIKIGKDGYKVVLTAGQTLLANTEYSLVASAASDGINVAGTSTIAFTVASDIAAPQIVSVSQKAANIAVKFNKEISADNPTLLTAGTDYKVLKVGDGGNYATLPVIKDGDDNTTLLIPVGNGVYGLIGGTTATIELTLKNVQDTYNNIMSGTLVQSMVLTKDTVKPTLVSATLNTANNREILLQFSEPVSTAAVSGAVIANNVTCLKVDNAYAVAIVPSDSLAKSDWTAYTATTSSSYIKLSLASALTAGANYKFTIAASTYKDASALNSNDLFTFTVSPVAASDSSKPTVTIAGGYNYYTNLYSLAAATKNEVVLTFNENVQVADVINPANYILDGAGLPSGVTIENISAVSTDSNLFKLVFGQSDIATTANVTLVVSNIRDMAGNVMDSTSANLAFVDTKKPALVSAAATAKDTVELTFNENLNVNPYRNVASGVYDVIVSDGTTTVNFDFDPSGFAPSAPCTLTIIGSKLIVKGGAGIDMTPINFANAHVEILAGIVSDQSVATRLNDAKASSANFPIADKFVAAAPTTVALIDRSVTAAAYNTNNYAEIGFEFVESANAANDGITTYKIYFVDSLPTGGFTNVSDLNNYNPVMTLNRAQIAQYKTLDTLSTPNIRKAIATSFTNFSDGTLVSSYVGYPYIIVVAIDASGNSAIVSNTQSADLINIPD